MLTPVETGVELSQRTCVWLPRSLFVPASRKTILLQAATWYTWHIPQGRRGVQRYAVDYRVQLLDVPLIRVENRMAGLGSTPTTRSNTGVPLRRVIVLPPNPRHW
jgi:hypothetical protein